MKYTLLLVACSAPYVDTWQPVCDLGTLPTSSVWVDDAFTLQQTAHIDTALATWSAMQCRVRYVRGSAHHERYVYAGTLPCPTGTAGCSNYLDAWIAPHSACQFATVAMHEVGHMVGMHHTFSGVMQPTCGGVLPRVTSEDLRVCRQTGICE